MALPTLPDPAALVTLGVDTHADTHVAVALDHAGRLLGTRTIPTTPAGYGALLAWAATLGTVDRVGVEGTGSYGAGLTRWLRAHGQVVVEVDRPDRAARRRQGKDDTLDAHAAARAVQAGTAMGIPKAADGQVEMLRSLRLARRSAVKARTQAANQLGALLVTAPDGLRARLRGLPLAELVTIAARLRPDPVPATPTDAAKFALRSVAGRWLRLTEEITELDVQLERLVATAAPALVAVKGAASRRCTTSAAEMARLRGALLEHEDTRARGAPGDGVLERRGRLRERTCRRDVEREQSLREELDQCFEPCAVGSDVDVCDLHPSFGRRRIAGDRCQAAVVCHGLQRDRRAAGGGVHGGPDATAPRGCVSHAGRPLGIVIVEHDARAVPADPRRAGGACRGDHGRSSRDRQLHGQSAGDAAGAVHQHPLAGRGRCGRCERLVGGERGHRERGRLLP